MDKFSLAKFGVVVKRCFQASGKPLRLHLRSSGESTYTLIKNHHISSSTIDKLRHNKPLNTTTINDLCRICEKVRLWSSCVYVVTGFACAIRYFAMK